MQIRVKRYIKLLVVTAVYLVVGFLIDKERFVWWVATALFWVLVLVLDDVVRSRHNTNRQVP